MTEYPTISFPKREWQNIKKNLATTGQSSTVRSCFEYGKYKLRGIYQTPWGNLIKIIKIQRFTRAEDIPTWTKMSKGMKISVKAGGRYGKNKFDWLTFSKY
jgi:hypothetical protein